MQALFQLSAIVIAALIGLRCGTAQVLTASDCGRTYGCIKPNAECTSSDDCIFLIKFRQNNDMIEAAVSVRGGQEWIALGFNTAGLMPGTRGVICQSVSSVVSMRVFHNTGYRTPTFTTPAAAQVVVSNTSRIGGALHCSFSLPFNGNSDLYNLNVTTTMYGLSAWGIIAPGTTTIQRHAPGSNFAQIVNVRSLVTHVRSKSPLSSQSGFFAIILAAALAIKLLV